MNKSHNPQTALHARFAGLGIAGIAALSLLTATPSVALAEEQADEPGGNEVELTLETDAEGDASSAFSEDAGDVVGADDAEGEGEQEAEQDDSAHEEDPAPEAGTPEAAEDPKDELPAATQAEEGERGASEQTGAEDRPAAEQEIAAEPSDENADDSETTAPAEKVDRTPVARSATSPAKAGTSPAAATTPSASTNQESTEEQQAPKLNGMQTVDGKTRYYIDDVIQKSFWFDAKGGKSYWFDATGELARDRVIAPQVTRDAKAGFYAYASSDGSIIKGRTATITVGSAKRIYIANAKGHLLALSGSKKQGFAKNKANFGGTSSKQWYYLYRDKSGADKGVYYAVAGYSTDTYAHFTRKEGYVVRGAYAVAPAKQGSRIYLATSKGKLASLPNGAKRGWIETKDFGTSRARRYYLIRDNSGADKGAYFARRGFRTDKTYAHFTTARGYVKTKTWQDASGHIYVANKQGKLATLASGKDSGWLTSSEFAKGSKRYYLYKETSSSLAKGAYYAIRGYTEKGTPHYTYANGSALTGVTTVDGHIYIATKKGKMLTLGGAKEGFSKVVNYGQGKQLYYLYKEMSGEYAGAYFAKRGYAGNVGKKTGHITLKKGYVLRGVKKSGSKIYVANGDGVLLTLGSGAAKGWTGLVDYGQGQQKYYLYKVTSGAMSGAYYAKKGYSTDGYAHYTTDKGYVLRNAYAAYDGTWYQAADNGKFTKLTKYKGWNNPSGYYQVSCFNCKLPSYANGFYTFVSKSRIRPDATKQQCIDAFINRAMEYLGTEYKWDWAMAPGQGVDCAGLVMQCLYAVGMQTPYNTYDHMYDPWQDHNAENMRVDGKFKQIGFSQRKRGDLIFYAGHVGIYLGNDRIINAYPPNVQVQSVYSWTVTGCSRVFI